MQLKNYSPVQDRLLALLRCALSDIPLNKFQFEGMSSKDWLELLEYAQQQGVCAVAFEAFNKSEVKPPIDELMEWLGQAEYVKSQNQTRSNSTKTVVSLLKEQNIDVLLLKGLSLCQLYPIPESREFGDLDIYTFDKHNEVLELVKRKGLDIEYNSKHDIFDYSNIHVELHKVFVGVGSKSGKILNDFLKTRSTKEQCIKTSNGWYEPNPTFNAIFLLRHLLVHLAYEGATMRNVLDWGLFLRKEGGKVNWDEVKLVLQESQHEQAFNTFTAVASYLTGADLCRYHTATADESLVQRVTDEVMNVQLHEAYNYGKVLRLFRKIQRTFNNHWMYASGLLPDKFFSDVIFGSIVSHIKHPEYI